ncbi:MAG: peptidoglycan binding domain-containing protein, partial [Bellilinea sp.]
MAYTLLYGANSTPVLAANSTWGGVPVGGLTASEAIARIEDVYSAPLELQYLGEIIQVSSDQLGFVLNSTAMADIATREAQAGFWARLWNKEALGSSVELQASVDGNKLRRYLENEIAPRYDRPAQKPQPIPGTTNFTNGGGGWELDVPKSSVKISKALMDPVNRSVKLEVTGVAIPTGDINNLEIFLKQTITNS